MNSQASGGPGMSNLSIHLHWHRNEPTLNTGDYSNQHTVQFNNDYDFQVDSAPDWGGDPKNTNPEQALASALSSCHMMTFLALAAKLAWPVATYHDCAEAHLGKNQNGKMSIVRIDLRPLVKFDTGFSVSEKELQDMHERAHRYCFVANALSDSVQIVIN